LPRERERERERRERGRDKEAKSTNRAVHKPLGYGEPAVYCSLLAVKCECGCIGIVY